MDTNAELKAEVALLRTEVAALKKMIEEMKKVVTACVRSSQKDNKQQMVLATPQVKDIISVVREDVKKEIFEAINTHMVPQMKAQVQWLNYQTEDTQELLTAYQMGQMTGSLKGISGGPSAQLHLGMLD
jgi:hypothetical protein